MTWHDCFKVTRLEFVLTKHTADQRVGISFVAEAEDEAEYGALVSRLMPDGLAAAAGLCKGDRVLTLNGVGIGSAATAAATIRASRGDVRVMVERQETEEDSYLDPQLLQEMDHAGDAVRKLRGWFAEATTPRGSKRERGLFDMMGQGVIRLMAPKSEHNAVRLWTRFDPPE